MASAQIIQVNAFKQMPNQQSVEINCAETEKPCRTAALRGLDTPAPLQESPRSECRQLVFLNSLPVLPLVRLIRFFG